MMPTERDGEQRERRKGAPIRAHVWSFLDHDDVSLASMAWPMYIADMGDV